MQQPRLPKQTSALHTNNHLTGPGVATRGRGSGSKGLSGGGAAVLVQLNVLWQVPQSWLVVGCWICLPVAVMPL